ncbi:MAG TPA: hypothetical protein VFA11_16650 [Acidimicrobiales bacterium]|nr:hypothetical protein [Acidimicrobiales bacterium]
MTVTVVTPAPSGGRPYHSDRARRGVRMAGPLALAGLGANSANLVVTVVVARLLSVRGYGSLNELVSVFLVLSMPGSALLVAVVRRVAAWEVVGLGDRVPDWARTVRRRGVAAAVVFAAVGWLAQGWVAGRLSLPSPAGVPETLAAGAVWALLCVERGLLQSRLAYHRLARNLAVEGAGRTVLTLGFVVAGWGVAGATGGLLGGVLCALVDARRSARTTPAEVLVEASAPIEVAGAPPAAGGAAPLAAAASTGTVSARDRRHLMTDLGVALASLALLAVLQSADVVIVGRLSPGGIGAYAAVSVAAKALVFAALVLCGFLLPEAATRWKRGEHAIHELMVALGVLAVPSAGLLLASMTFGRQLLSIVFGPRLTAAAPAFAPLVAAMWLLGTTVLLTHYLLGVGHRRIVGLLAAAAVAGVVVITQGGGSPYATAWRDLALQAALAGVAASMVIAVHNPARRHP